MTDPTQTPSSSPGARPRATTTVLAVVAAVLSVIGVAAVALAATRGPDRPPAAPPAASGPATPSAGATSTERAEVTAVAPLSESRPTRVRIPRIGVDSTLLQLGLQGDGTMAVPPGPTPAGWYELGPAPGQVGAAVLAGHVTYNGTRGVFFALGALRAGDRVLVSRQDGRTAVFAVTSSRRFAKSRFPTDVVYGPTSSPELRLITCAGDYDAVHHRYADNLVVFGRLVGVA